jgi:Holliday junction resolvase - archaeal type
MFLQNGYSVMRSAGSGVNSISPDIISYKNGKGFAFECKAWDRGSLSIDIEKFECLMRWKENTSMETFIAWRVKRGGWFFVRLEEMERKEMNYTVTMKSAVELNRRFETIVLK